MNLQSSSTEVGANYLKFTPANLDNYILDKSNHVNDVSVHLSNRLDDKPIKQV